MAEFNQNELIVSQMATDFSAGFQSLFLTYYSPLLRIAERMIGAEFAEDAVQDTFLAIWNNKLNFENVLSLKSYLYTSVHNKCLNIIRTNQQLEKYKVEHPTEQAEEYILDEDVIAQLYQAMDLLPEHYKEAMIKSLNGESIADIALSMNTTEDSVKAYKRRAKRMLKEKLCNDSLVLLLFIV